MSCLLRSVTLGFALGILLVWSDAACAQFSGTPKQSKNPAMKNDGPVLLPGLGVPQTAQNQQLTPEQAIGIMQLRALQGRGRGQVKTGLPQFIPMGPQLMGPGSFNAPQQDNQQGAERKSSAERRAEARKAREEKNAQAREEAKAKKAAKENKKGAAGKKAKSVKGAKDEGKKARDADAEKS
jgi:hypothetical protein